MVGDGGLSYVDSFFPWFQEDDGLHDEILVRMSLFACSCISDEISAI